MMIDIQVQIPDPVVQMLQQQGLMVGTAFSLDDGGFTSVIWSMTQPAAQISYQWDGQYGLFVAPAKIADGAPVQVIASQADVDTGKIYPYLFDGTFGSSSGKAPSGDVGVDNQSSDTMAFGLLQALSINGEMLESGPIIIASLPAGKQLSIPAITKINYFIVGNLQPNTIITGIPSPSIAVDTSTKSSADLVYDGNSWSAD